MFTIVLIFVYFSSGLVCMKSSSSVVELVMLLCSQASLSPFLSSTFAVLSTLEGRFSTEPYLPPAHLPPPFHIYLSTYTRSRV